ncbi:sensor histidine kinase [Salininema proteolyticum]|uniref:histidine kinase n=1 Tax=Salininema proteolyticum TaxID=1607685 RepID=A0ABV8TZI9_9ACTN
MSTLREIAGTYTNLSSNSAEHLQRLVSEWQLLADLSFADFLLWGAVADRPGTYVCLAQVRPTTSQTAYEEDQVGRLISGIEAQPVHTAFTEKAIYREGDPVWHGDVAARHESIPVRRRDRNQVIAVAARDTNLSDTRSPSHLELNYLKTADYLVQMLSDGGFPPPLLPGEPTTAPRIGDGLVRIGADGLVRYASPNALSAFRRMGVTGHLRDRNLMDLIRNLTTDPDAGADSAKRIGEALAGETPRRRQIEAKGATILMRALPLRPEGKAAGALVLVRDMTEIRRLDRELVTKDATIREIHHRVKNNLQTVAALLRLQARRVGVPQARLALEESVRRVASIALVHETLSQSNDEAVGFDLIVDRVASMAAEVSAAESKVVLRREGTFGVLPSEVATPLVMVINELIQNAVEHAYEPGAAGEVVIDVERDGDYFTVFVRDFGRGLPEGFSVANSNRLGLQIVHTLVTGELRGTIEMRPGPEVGTEAVLKFNLQ